MTLTLFDGASSYNNMYYLRKHLRNWISLLNYIIDFLVCQVKITTFASCKKRLNNLLGDDLINVKSQDQQMPEICIEEDEHFLRKRVPYRMLKTEMHFG